MKRIRQAWPLLLLAIFWVAQVQGTVHAISHLRGLEGATKQSLSAPSGFCVECAALAQAGAAPLPAPPSTVSLPPSLSYLATMPMGFLASIPLSFYRSRAPPLSPI